MKRFLSLQALALFMMVFVSAAHSAPANEKDKVFPKPNCNTELAAESLKERFQKDPMPSFDGNLPWPGVYGAWLNQGRGIWIRVHARQLNNDSTQMFVEIKSVCSNRLLASGNRLLNETDWKRASLNMRLKDNRAINGEDLSVTLRTRQIGENPILEVRLMDSAKDQGSTQIDQFAASRL